MPFQNQTRCSHLALLSKGSCFGFPAALPTFSSYSREHTWEYCSATVSCTQAGRKWKGSFWPFLGRQGIVAESRGNVVIKQLNWLTCVAQVSASDGSDLWNQLAKVRHPAHPCSGRSSQEYNQPSRMLRQESTDDSPQQGYKHKLYHVVPMIYLRSYIVGADKADPHLGRARVVWIWRALQGSVLGPANR